MWLRLCVQAKGRDLKELDWAVTSTSSSLSRGLVAQKNSKEGSEPGSASSLISENFLHQIQQKSGCVAKFNKFGTLQSSKEQNDNQAAVTSCRRFRWKGR
jgi:hypothetical protein